MFNYDIGAMIRPVIDVTYFTDGCIFVRRLNLRCSLCYTHFLTCSALSLLITVYATTARTDWLHYDSVLSRVGH
jgi:hypothetical protein